jgi:hypothetical protein
MSRSKIDHKLNTRARPEPVIVEHEGGARGPVCADDALVAGNRKQHT